jgi:oxidase EvaA
MVVQVQPEEEIPINADFRWLTIGQLKWLMIYDSVVNMDSRTVLACLGFGNYSDESLRALNALAPRSQRSQLAIDTALNSERALHDFGAILSWISRIKATYDLEVSGIPLREVRAWEFKEGIIQRADRKYFSVIGVTTEIANREVHAWDQPMIEPAQEGLVAFLVKPVNGILHFLVQAKLEPGNLDVIELAPTVQCLTGNYRTGHNEYSVPYIHEVLGASKHEILFDSRQSEEGGRFFREENRSMIVSVGEDLNLETFPNFCWMTLNQMYRFVEFNNYVNISARSLMACFPFA